MGFIANGIKSIGKAVGGIFGIGGGGGGGGGGDNDKAFYQNATKAGLFNRAGIKQNADGSYDYSQVGKPITGAAGIAKATSGYDFSPVNEAISGYRRPSLFTQTYNSGYAPRSYGAYNFNFSRLPAEYGNLAYEQGAKDIRREGAGQLEQAREAVGPRRIGLLSKMNDSNNRNVSEQLAKLNSDIRLNEMNKNIDLGRAEQEAQAGENLRAAQFGDEQSRFAAGEGYKGYQSRADLERANEDNRLRNIEGLYNAGQGKISAESGLVENERNYEDQALKYLMDMFGSTAGLNQQSAALGEQKRANTLGFLGNIAKAIAGA